MASSQDKAIALKDAYIKGIVDATSEAPAMPEQDMGDTASAMVDLNRGTATMRHDGDPHVYIKKGGSIKRSYDERMAYPGYNNKFRPSNDVLYDYSRQYDAMR